MTRPLYRHAELDRVLNPKSIAVVGASPKAGSFGDRVLGNLDAFDGDIYLVNSKYEQVGERRCFASIASLPVVPDCVAVTVPRESVEDVVREAARAGAGGVILFASGYAETQLPERIEQQRRLGEIARESGLKILGPNCLGIANYLRRARVSFSEYPAPRELRGISVGIASQSGALSQSLAQAIESGASVSHAFSAGNQADVAGAVALAVEEYGGLDVCFANAGISGGLVPFFEETAERWTQVLKINLIGTFLAAKHAALAMVPRGWGSIICTASVAGLRSGAGGLPYSASKAGVISLVQTAANQLAGTGVRVNAICPGLIETGMTRPIFEQARARGSERKIGQLNPLRRPGAPGEIAQTALFLASDASSYVNGQAIAVDGGLSTSHPVVMRRD